MTSTSTGYTRIYTAHGKVAHLSRPYPAPVDALCPNMTGWRGVWLGLGGQDQYDTAMAMTLCRACERAAAQPPETSRPQPCAGAGAGTSPDAGPAVPQAGGDAAAGPESPAPSSEGSPGRAATTETPAGVTRVRDVPPAGSTRRPPWWRRLGGRGSAAR